MAVPRKVRKGHASSTDANAEEGTPEYEAHQAAVEAEDAASPPDDPDITVEDNPQSEVIAELADPDEKPELEDEAEPFIKTPKDKRAELFAEIARRDEENEASEESAPPPEGSAPDAGEADDDPDETADDDETLTLKVNRQERTLPKKEVIDLAQQQIAGQANLAESKVILQKVRELEAQLADRVAQPVSPETPPTRDDDGQPDEQVVQWAQEIAERIQTGDLDEATQGVLSLAQSMAKTDQSQSVDPAKLSELIAATAQTEFQNIESSREVENELRRFGEDNPEIAADDVLQLATLKQVRAEQQKDIENLKVDGALLTEAELAPIRKDPTIASHWHKEYRKAGYPVRQMSEILDAAGRTVKATYVAAKPEPGDTLKARQTGKREHLQKQPRRASIKPAQTTEATPTLSEEVAKMKSNRVGRRALKG